MIRWFCTAIVALQLCTIANDILMARLERAIDEAFSDLTI